MGKGKRNREGRRNPLVTWGSGGVDGFNKFIDTLDLSNAVFVGSDEDEDLEDYDPEDEPKNEQRKTAIPQVTPCKPL